MAETPKTKESAQVQFWLDQLGDYKQEFQDWEKKCKKIIRRYRDERDEKSDGTPTEAFRFNALWSNVQTLQPAIYIKAPKPIAERRFLDKDTMARYASMTLERSLDVQIEVGYLHSSMQRAVQDYLLCGRGTVWERYEPTYGEPIDVGPQSEEMEEGGTDEDDEDEEGPPPVRPVTFEKVCTDYVAYDRFSHSLAPVWEDVWWVAKEDGLTRDELRARFKEIDQATKRPIADLIPLQSDLGRARDDRGKYVKGVKPKLARVIEIWDKSKRQVVFIAPDWPNAPLEVRDDPLGLENFWPCPKPLYATTTNDTLVPVPDYVEYQDQADELDNITSRIKALTDAIRVNGVYDASYPELKRILQEGVDNRLIGVKNYAEFSSKGGLESAIDFIPIKDVVEALIRLYEARDRVKADMAEITGISDIIRGQAQGQAKTATEQRIKGQFASLRLEDRKKDVARFCCDAIRIAGEIVSEHFSPEILAEMTGMLPFIETELQDDLQAAQAQQAQQPQQASAGVSPPPAAGAPGAPPSSGAGMLPPVQEMAKQKFEQVCALLRDDKMRTFRIDIETDSTIEVDKQAEKESVVELLTALGGMLEKSMAVGQMAPELVPALGQSLLFAFRRFGAGRDVEGAWEGAVDQMIRKAKNPAPKQPSPEEIKAQAEQQKQQMETQRMQQEAALEERRGQQEMALEQQKAQMELQQKAMELRFKERELELKERELNMTMAAKQQENAINQQAKERDAAIDEAAAIRKAEIDERADVRGEQMAERAAERETEAGEQQFKLQKRTAELKAKQAAKPKKEDA